MTYRQVIDENIARITAGIDAEKYPALSGYLYNGRSRLQKDLLVMLEHMQNSKPSTTYDGNKYWRIYKGYMVQKYHGSSRMWHSHLVFLSLTGLLYRVKPNAKTKNREMAAAYQKAIEANKAPEIFYSVKLYSRAVLRSAEAQARRFKDRGVSLSDIRKTDIIALYDQETADLFYQDKRTISAADDQAAQILFAAIIKQIEAREYTTKEDAVSEALLEELDRAFEGKLSLYSKICHQAAQMTAFCQDHNLIYRRAKKDECLKWGMNYGKKIIVRE